MLAKTRVKLIPKVREKNGKKQVLPYQVEFYDPTRNPTRKRVSLGTKDKKIAAQKVAEYERKLYHDKIDPWTDTLREDGQTVQQAIDEFIASRKAEGRKPKTLQGYQEILNLFVRSVPPDFLIANVRATEFERFMEGRKHLKDTSRATYTRHLRAFFGWCITEGLLRDLPIPGNHKRRAPKKNAVEFITPEQYHTLLGIIQQEAGSESTREGTLAWMADVVKVAVNTGLRLGEICRLRWNDIDLATGYLTVRESKSGHERRVFLAGDALEVIERLQQERTTTEDGYVLAGVNGGKLNAHYVSKRFRYYRAEAKLPGSIHFHSLRHTFASWAAMGGMDLFKLKEIMGHSDIKVTLIYSHLSPEAQRIDMERIFGQTKKAGITQEEEQEREELVARLGSLQEERDRLQQELEQEKQEHLALEEEVARLRQELQTARQELEELHQHRPVSLPF